MVDDQYRRQTWAKEMLLILADAVVLIVLLKVVTEDDLEFKTAVVLSQGAAIGAVLLVYGLVSAMGLAGLVVALVLAAVGLGATISALFGVEIKRSFLIGVLFMVAHVGISEGLQAMLTH